MKYFFSTLILIGFIAIGCNNSKKDENTKTFSKIPTEFLEFYDKFHEDSTFQLNHITFPLDGKRTDDNSFTQWQKNEWSIHRKIEPDGHFYSKFLKLNDTLIEEYIIEKQSHAYLKRRWAKISKDWYLVYYQDLSLQ